MSKHFIVGTDEITKEDQEAFIRWLDDDYAWWHWIDGMWLILDETNELTAGSIRDKLLAIAPNMNTMVFEVSNDIVWAGFGPKSDKRNMFEWMDETWDDDTR